mmetsp:Transcript_5958/g.8042  ORF Transcript_5958/g.8042 Transcript_5958/m.8042 type:complete len:423 (+) Transcript_5958:163-1431(+)|eukprot:CAMPEP_0196574006 /NCGR_PEP_ID=MMETSP1081-20130531/3803_1 /TAXON_ID=36882 /ORGANISM="Pyramimonas amylifera, Strain CCMP720" /LENGTH=422 /DNA_ID=CAMNT_0041891893 /DNA_START=161 /DNA_END=1429 /DNA_ORIENTATION=+
MVFGNALSSELRVNNFLGNPLKQQSKHARHMKKAVCVPIVKRTEEKEKFAFEMDEKKDMQRHVPWLDRQRYKMEQSRSKQLPNFNESRRVSINVTEKALKKTAKKAMKNFVYNATLEELSIELVHLQEYIKDKGLKVAILFEGRDAAGKGGVITRISSAMSPRVCRVCALGVPTEVEKTQWYFQRYIQHLPAAGEMVLFDRSWYNRGGVEKVMGFCSDEQYEEFMRATPLFEEMLVNSGIILIKYWFSVDSEEQERRFIARMTRSWKRWKLSPMDLLSRTKWLAYTKAKEEVFKRTSSEACPWTVVPANNKKVARLNCISHILATIDYDVQEEYPHLALPPRGPMEGYTPLKSDINRVPQIYNEENLLLNSNSNYPEIITGNENSVEEEEEPFLSSNDEDEDDNALKEMEEGKKVPVSAESK